MQTFLPYPDFEASARVLDDKRLRNQQNEALVIARTVLEGGGWARHPAVKMWQGALASLCHYGLAIGREALRRGFREYHRDWFTAHLGDLLGPWWLGQEAFHAAHRAALLVKNPEWYGQFGWSEEPRVQYIWPKLGEQDA